MQKLQPQTSDPASRPVLKRLTGLIACHWRPLAIAAGLLVMSSLISLSLPVAVRWLVDTIFSNHDLSELNIISLALVGLFVLQSIFSVIHTFLVARVGQRIVADLRLQIYEHVQSLPLRFFTERRTGEIVSRVSNDVTVIQQAITEVPISFLGQLITLSGGIVMMLVMNWRLTLFVFALVPPILAFGLFFGRRLEKLSSAVQDRLADSTVVLEEMLSGIRVVKSFVREIFEQQRFSRQIELAYATALKRARLRALFIPLITFLGFGAVIFLLWYGGHQVVQGTITTGELIAFLIYMIMVIGPIGSFTTLYAQIREAMGAAQRMFELLDAAPEPFDTPGALQPGRLQGQVRFVDVGFAYDHAQQVLEDVSLDVRPGEVLAIVGPSGVGKTTLVNLIPRFYDPTTGRIEIDGIDTRKFDLCMLREQIGLVPQETFLFGGTIRENIAYGRPGASDEEIVTAAKAANAHEFIVALPDGYDTMAGEKGVKLSMGQRQRITIARVLLKDPRILILDEATSSLDSEAEWLVQEALDRLMDGRTTFVIAHRLSTIQRADRIVVLKDGRIVEQGRHNDLLAQGGLYHHLWSLQFAEVDEIK
ncbi:MAG TPA: ABC transporter ATP-binding protein [Longilinea sp.]|nr:ABC transporter ATP-binding protein [Longilinea sp.]